MFNVRVNPHRNNVQDKKHVCGGAPKVVVPSVVFFVWKKEEEILQRLGFNGLYPLVN